MSRGIGHGAIPFWILDLRFWIKFQSKISNLKSQILTPSSPPLPTPHSPLPS
ncbi:MAG: hypothetical protein V7K27_22090 [Nostoc sp.]|uniref:hypothetical protein n=1 Tax=Nostoc sp. TaxID=1180 RepID=UPI002FF46935